MAKNHFLASTEPPSFDVLFKRMLANWSVNDPEMRAEKSRIFRDLHDKVGGTRFAAGVRHALEGHFSPYFPTLAEFLQFVPERKRQEDPWRHSEAEWDEMRAEQSTPEWQEAYAKLQETIKNASNIRDMNSVLNQKKREQADRVEAERKKVQSFREHQREAK